MQKSDIFQHEIHYNKKWNLSKVNNKDTRKTSKVSLLLTVSLTLRILFSLFLILNIFHILLLRFCGDFEQVITGLVDILTSFDCCLLETLKNRKV